MWHEKRNETKTKTKVGYNELTISSALGNMLVYWDATGILELFINLDVVCILFSIR